MQTNTKRIIARLDVKGPNLIKGIELDGLRVLGKASAFAQKYYLEGIDELIFQDVVASLYRRNSLIDMISETAKEVFVPITVLGGLRSVEDMRKVLLAGADKVGINTAAIENPKLISEGAKVFGSQCIVSSIEAYRKANGDYEVWTDYGREPSRVLAKEWAKQVEELGAGEIMLTIINQDGTGKGYDTEFASYISDLVSIPVILSGGAGKKEHIENVLQKTNVEGVVVGSLFHYHYASELNRESDYRAANKGLRMGEHIDTGNMDFLFYGYGGDKDLLVEPSSIKDVKTFLKNSNHRVRI